jgi:hypothetical protein
MKWFIYKIKEGFEGNWDEAIAQKQCEVVLEVEADDWNEAYEKASELGYEDTDTYGITNIEF